MGLHLRRWLQTACSAVVGVCFPGGFPALNLYWSIYCNVLNKIVENINCYLYDPNPSLCNCGTPSLPPTILACWMDFALVAMIQRDLSPMKCSKLGFPTAFPQNIVVCTVRTFFKWCLQHKPIHNVGHVECRCPLVHPNVCLLKK